MDKTTKRLFTIYFSIIIIHYFLSTISSVSLSKLADLVNFIESLGLRLFESFLSTFSELIF
jgi:hypothetical protein